VRIAHGVWLFLSTTIPAHMDGGPFILEPGYHKIEVKEKALKVILSK